MRSLSHPCLNSILIDFGKIKWISRLLDISILDIILSVFAGHLIIEQRQGERTHFSCRLCGKSFSRKLHIIHHINCHMGERPFQCDFCDRRFTQKVHCRAHMRSHTGEKPHVCSFCGQGFTQKSHMTSHMATHYGVEMLPPE